jgi:hypothetical protein
MSNRDEVMISAPSEADCQTYVDDLEDAAWRDEYRREVYPTLAEQKEDEMTMTLAQLEERRGNFAEQMKKLTETMANDVSSIDDIGEDDFVPNVKGGDEEPFYLGCIGEFADALNDLPIVAGQWQNAVNAVIRRKAQMSGNGEQIDEAD